MNKPNSILGLVVALKANFLEVEINMPDSSLLKQDDIGFNVMSMRLLCTKRQRLHHRGLSVHVGDSVLVEAINLEEKTAVISDVLPRKSWLNRPSVANVTDIIVAISLRQPLFDFEQATRFLMAAEQTGASVNLLLTKSDLINQKELEFEIERIQAWGYKPLAISIKTGEGIESFERALKVAGLAVICGPSGVGKTSILKHFISYDAFRIGKLSSKLKRGMNTTRHVELYKFGRDTFLADTPGFNRPELHEDPRTLSFLFPEIREQLKDHSCRFRDCLHRDEPGCCINKDWERYSLYLNCIEEMVDSNRQFQGG